MSRERRRLGSYISDAVINSIVVLVYSMFVDFPGDIVEKPIRSKAPDITGWALL